MKSKFSQPLAVVAIMFGALLPVIGAGGYTVHSLVNKAFVHLELVDEATRLTDLMLQLQLDQETGVRGFAATGKAIFLDPYFSAHQLIAPTANRLSSTLLASGLGNTQPILNEALSRESDWNRLVAIPLIETSHPSETQNSHLLTTEFNGKRLVDLYRSDIATLLSALHNERTVTSDEVRSSIDRIAWFMLLIFLGVIGVGYGFMNMQIRYIKRLEETRRLREEDQRRSSELRSELALKTHVTETLQQALSQRPLPALPRLQFSAMYAPAAEEANIGGDWYDVIELPDHRALIVIGDVAGHGIDAAVGMSRARQEFSSAALRSSNPAEILTAVNLALLGQGSHMVTALCGIVDSSRFEFIYASAGHPPPVIAEPDRLPRALTLGGIPLGITAQAEYKTTVVQTLPGALIVLYTDGAVEHSRSILDGESLLLEASAASVIDTSNTPAQAIHARIFNSRHALDDVAIITMSFSSDGNFGLRHDGERAHLTVVPERQPEDNSSNQASALLPFRSRSATSSASRIGRIAS